MRLRWIALLAVSGALLGCTASNSGRPEPPTSSTGTPRTSTSAPTTTPPSPPQVSDMAGVFIAALGGGPGTERHQTGAHTYIRDHTVCSEILNVNPCPPEQIPQRVQDEVVAALGPSVGFTDDPPTRLRVDRQSVVTLGRPHIAGDRATVTVETNCGPLCGLGETLVLARRADGWVRTGTTGSSWIS